MIRYSRFNVILVYRCTHMIKVEISLMKRLKRN